MRVSVTVRGVFWKTIDLHDHHDQISFSLRQGISDIHQSIEDTIGHITCDIIRTDKSVTDLFSGYGKYFIQTTYSCDIEDPSICIFDENNLIRINNNKNESYEKIDFTEQPNRFEILDL